MKKNLVLISHGYFCEELKKSLEMIMGNQETIYTVPFLPSESSETYFKKLETIVSPLDQVTIFADLMGGTPCNVATKMVLQGAPVDLYAGMNLPMVIEFVMSDLTNQKMSLLDSARNNILYVNDLIQDSEDDGEEDE